MQACSLPYEHDEVFHLKNFNFRWDPLTQFCLKEGSRLPVPGEAQRDLDYLLKSLHPTPKSPPVAPTGTDFFLS